MLPSVGVFVADSVARLLVQLMKKCDFNVTTLCGNSSLAEIRRLAEEYQIASYTRKTEEFLLSNDVNMVVLSGDPYECARLALKALKIGKHVLTISPCGVKVSQANEMMNSSHPKLLSLVNHPLRFLPAFSKARELIKMKHIGDIFLCECTIHTSSLIGSNYDWRCDVTTGGGILQTYGSHVIDILAFLLDERANEVQGLVETFATHTAKLPKFRELKSDDFCSFQMKYTSGVRACVLLNSNMGTDFRQTITIVGSKGNVKLVNGSLYVQMNHSTNTQELHVEQYCESVTPHVGDIPQMYTRGMEYFLADIKKAFQNVGQSNEYLTVSKFFEDKRLVDHNLLEAAANFHSGRFFHYDRWSFNPIGIELLGALGY